jgi:hypothetical protein
MGQLLSLARGAARLPCLCLVVPAAICYTSFVRPVNEDLAAAFTVLSSGMYQRE